MAKFFGKIGYVTTIETRPGVWVETPIERNYYGEVFEELFRTQETENLNSNFTIGNWFSILADPYAYENYSAIRYVKWMGATWSIREVKNKSPRIHLKIGGLYNGPVVDDADLETPTTSDNP